MWKKFFLSSLLVLLLSPAYGVKILHPGVKINSQKISETMYLVTATEMASFTAWKIMLDKTERELIRKEAEVDLYRDFNKNLINKYSSIQDNFMKTSEELISQLRGREKDRQRADRRAKRSNLVGTVVGVLLSGGLKHLKDIFK